MPKLSLIIPTLNEETELPKLLDSIRQQSFRNWELVVADAHSTDRTREIATAAGGRVVTGGLPGPGRNAGARVAHGELLLFLDADVVLPDEQFLERVVGEFEERTLDIATVMLKPLSDRARDKLLYLAYDWYTFAVQKWIPHAPGFFILVRRPLHEKINGFDETLDFAEDHEYAIRAKRSGGRFGFLHVGRIPVSVRRLESDGRGKIARQCFLGEWYLITRGKVPPGVMQYKFGHHKK